jgi:hypothetical protein
MSEKPTLGDATVASLPDLAFRVLEAGVGEVRRGDITFRRPDNPVGVRVENMPTVLRTRLAAKPSVTRKVIWSYHATKAGIVTADIKLVCEVHYNGPEVEAHFELPADGMRSRLGTDTTIEVLKPFALERIEAPPAWKAAGIHVLPVVEVPVSIVVDEPWPNSNTKVTFAVVLSGLYGLGDSSGGEFYRHYTTIKD